MTIVECPWCEGDAQVETEQVSCERCGVVVEIAADPERHGAAIGAERRAA